MYRKYAKRVLDFVFALYLLLPITLVVIVCALLIRLEDWGPAFYVEKRVGRYGRVFKTFRFRTIKINAADIQNSDNAVYYPDDDQHLTNIGKFIIKSGIGELPQLFNILMGDMSFIGPRPDLWNSMRHYKLEELRKLQAHPGITGYNQAFCRNSTEWEQQLLNDIYYADNVSIVLDLKILSRTIEADLFPKGIKQ